MTFKAEAFVHSLNKEQRHSTNTAEVTILEHRDNNNVIAEYNGKRCTAKFNPYTNRYYVDDVYGIISDRQKSLPDRGRER